MDLSNITKALLNPQCLQTKILNENSKFKILPTAVEIAHY